MTSSVGDIRRQAEACRDLFIQCLSISEGPDLDWLENRQGDFNLWACATNAITFGKSSLDYKVRGRPDVHDALSDLLSALEGALAEYKLPADSSNADFSLKTDKDLSMDSKDVLDISFSDFSSAEEDSTSHSSCGDEPKPIVSEQASNIKSILEQLVRLSNAIRRSATKHRYCKADASLNTKDYDEFRDYLRFLILRDFSLQDCCELTVEESVAHLNLKQLNNVQERLIHANIMRRNRILVTMMGKPSPEATYSLKAPPLGLPKVAGKLQASTTEGELANKGIPEAHVEQRTAALQSSNIIPSSLAQTATDIGSNFNLQAATVKQADRSAVTRVTRIGTSQDYPSCPTHQTGGTLLCPYCAELLSKDHATDSSRWRGHVASDILPYTCVYEPCATPYAMYSTSDELLDHIHEQHSCNYWVCTKCCLKQAQKYNFRTFEEWEDHMNKQHGYEYSPAVYLFSLSEVSKRTAPREVACPFCGEDAAAFESNFDHIAAHLHAFALTCLPWGTSVGDADSMALLRAETSGSTLSSNKADYGQESTELQNPWHTDNAASVISIDNPDFQRSLAETKYHLDRVKEILAGDALSEQEFKGKRQLYAELESLSAFQYSSVYRIGLVGSSGVGKSSLINSLLDMEGLSRTSNSGWACTLVATEFHFHVSSDFVIDIEWSDRNEITSQLQELLRYYRLFLSSNESLTDDELKHFQSQYDLAHETFQSLLGAEMNGYKSFLLGEEEKEVLHHLGGLCDQHISTVKKGPRRFTDVAKFKSTLASLTSYNDYGSSASLGAKYLMRKVKVFLAAPILSHGVILTDLPGLGDSSSFRRKITERYLLECDEIWAVCNIGRAVADTGVEDVFNLAEQTGLRNVNIVCTKSDSINAHEALHDWGHSSTISKELLHLMEAKETAQELVQHLRNESEALMERFESLTQDDETQLIKNRKRLFDAEKQEKKAQYELNSFIVGQRNEIVTKSLMDCYGERLLDNDLLVFAVSSTYYRDVLERKRQDLTSMSLLSGIPKLRNQCTATNKLKVSQKLLRYMTIDVPSLLDHINLWIGSISSQPLDRSGYQSESDYRNLLKSFKEEFDTQLDSGIAKLDINMSRLLFNFISPHVHSDSWCRAAIHEVEAWCGWHNKVIAAFCRKYGQHRSVAVGYHSWNLEVLGSMIADLAVPWKRLLLAIHNEKQVAYTLVLNATNHLKSQLGIITSKSHTLMETIVTGVETSVQRFLTHVDSVFTTLDTDLRNLNIQMFSGIRTSFIGEQMEDAYNRASREAGKGSHNRKLKIIMNAFGDPTLFETLYRLFTQRYNEIGEQHHKRVLEAVEELKATFRDTWSILYGDNGEDISRDQLRSCQYLKESIQSAKGAMTAIQSDLETFVRLPEPTKG